MSQIITSVKSPLWKQGNKGNIEFVSSFKRLEREQPDTFKQIRQEEGFIYQDHEYEYKVGKNQYGLWLSRRKMGLGIQQIESKADIPLKRPPMSESELSQDEIAILKQFVALIKVIK